MNILLKKFPTKLKVGNKIYEINSDFRNCLAIISAYEDESLTIQEKYYILLKRLYKKMPDDIEEAIKKAVLFLNCGKEVSNDEDTKRLYSFNKDGEVIYSAVSQTHDIDLESIEYLHWWKFVFFFMDVDKDCTFSYILSLRQKKNKGKLDKEEKRVWIDMRETLDLDYNPDEEFEDNEFMQKLKRGEADAQVNQH